MTFNTKSFSEQPNFISTPLQNMVAAMAGGEHSFLKQICKTIQYFENNGSSGCNFQELFKLVDGLIESSDVALKLRWMDRLSSFSNQRLFQAIGELVAVGHMTHAGWKVHGLENDCIQLSHALYGPADLLTLSIILDRNLDEERLLETKILEQIESIESDYVLSVVFRTPLHRNVRILDIQQTVQTWLKRINLKKKRTCSGYYKDTYTHIDFSAVRRKSSAKEITVQTVLQPIIGQKMKHVVQDMLTQSVEKHRHVRNKNHPLFVSIVSNQALGISDRAWKFMLYGLERCKYNKQIELDPKSFDGWFQDPFRTFVGGLLNFQHNPNLPVGTPCFQLTSFTNPWTEFEKSSLGIPLPGYCTSRNLQGNWILHKCENDHTA